MGNEWDGREGDRWRRVGEKEKKKMGKSGRIGRRNSEEVDRKGGFRKYFAYTNRECTVGQ